MKVRRLKLRFYKKAGGPRGIGNRCSVYCAGCIVCESYKHLDERGRFPTWDEVNVICEEENRRAYEADRRAATQGTTA